MTTPSSITRCPRCNRMVGTNSGRYNKHSVTAGDRQNLCAMTKQRIAVTGLTDQDFEARAVLVCDLASQLQDVEPVIVWDYLTAVPAVELQRMLMVALTAVPVDQKIADVFGWVCDLPIAQPYAAAVTA